MALKEAVGKSVGPFRLEATQARLNLFAKSVCGDPAYLPTFATVCREGEFELLKLLGVDLARVLHGEQEYEFHGCDGVALKAGQVLEYSTRLADVIEKSGSGGWKMTFLILDTEVRDYAKSRTTFIVREKQA